ncbi:AAA family ATPase [Fusarium austroafricanum]|uniref:AAA family ATPase n=1 Tax=Fusarium austroafricanum TaxID=2364996 RepID=A0A8H4NVL2_9HYPO|nr:AAA family ATPase [Fusarium austroafricanum]
MPPEAIPSGVVDFTIPADAIQDVQKIQPKEQDGLDREKADKASEVDPIEEALARLAEMNELLTAEKVYENRGDVKLDAMSSMHDIFCKELLDKNRRLGQLNMRSWQAAIHHNFTSMRIQELEKEVKELKKRVYELGDEHEFADPQDKFPIHVHELKRSNPYEFGLNKDVVLLPTAQQPGLEVRLAEGATAKHMVSPKKDANSQTISNRPDTLSEVLVEATPERLRIRSRPLMSHLEKLTATLVLSRAGGDRVDGNSVFSGMVFLRPFKFFVKHEEAIRNSVADVEAKVKEEEEEDSGIKTEPKKNSRKEDDPDRRSFDAKDLLEDLKLLITFLDTDLRPTFNLRQKIKDGIAQEIEYADLMHLFERGDLVVARADPAYARMVVNVAGGREPLIDKLRNEEKEQSTPVNGFAIDCISLGSDGSSFVPKLERFSIRKFHGRQLISSLLVYPLKFDPNAEALRTKFLNGGNNFSKVTSNSFCHKRAVGKTVDEPSINLDAEVIVDMTLAMNAKSEWRSDSNVTPDDFTRNDRREVKERPWCEHRSSFDVSCCGSDTIFNDLELDELDAQEFLKKKGYILQPLALEDLTDEHLMIMRPYVHAFILRSRQWVTIRSEDLQEVVFRNSFDDLVVPDNHKTTVQALVTTHESARSPLSSTSEKSSIGSMLDLVQGKGSGLVILLHGPPGVGKTSTAECVADDTKRPLFPITCGDIGETAADVEHNLQSHFQLAHKWGCVLLLDEADIFLAKRTRSDLRHNAVTSVFLRSLEYYAGILFLTTNRVGVIDPAFRSRIQMSLFYPQLSLDVTCKLYEKFIRRAKAEQLRQGSYLFRIKEKEILKFGKKHFRGLEKEGYEAWNGRQIRNAFQTAIALAEHQSMTLAPGDPPPILGKEQFEVVARGSMQFDEYLNKTLGATDADMARREGWRNDGYKVGAGNPAIPMVPMAMPPSAYHAQSRQAAAMKYNSDDDSDSESESDEDSDEDMKKTGKGKSGTVEKGDSATGGETPGDMDEFREYMMWKKMKSQLK